MPCLHHRRQVQLGLDDDDHAAGTGRRRRCSSDAAPRPRRKKSLPAIERLRLEPFTEGRSAQVLHVGPYATEGPTIQRLHEFIADHGCEPVGKHHEIYLNDPSRTAPEKLRTIIRQPVRQA